MEIVRVALVVAVFAVAAAPSAAQAQRVQQQGQNAAKTDSALVGTWEGTYSSDHAPSGAMKVVIERGSDAKLKVSAVSMMMGQNMTAIPARNTEVSATDISWTQDMMGMSCEATAILKSSDMKGSIVCGHGAVTFVLVRR